MVESGKLQVSATAAAAAFLRVMSSAHTHTHTELWGKIVYFPIRVVFLYHIRTHLGFIRNISTPISCAAIAFCYLLKVLRDVGEKSTFCSLALPATASVCVCCECVCVGNYAKWSTMEFAALVPPLDTNSVGIFYLTVLSFFQPSFRRCFNTGNASTERAFLLASLQVRERESFSHSLLSCFVLLVHTKAIEQLSSACACVDLVRVDSSRFDSCLPCGAL